METTIKTEAIPSLMSSLKLSTKAKYGAAIEDLQPNHFIVIDKVDQAPVINFVRRRYGSSKPVEKQRMFTTMTDGEGVTRLLRLK